MQLQATQKFSGRMPQIPRRRRAARVGRRARGLALLEVMICATIAAMMLTATGLAFKASVLAFRDSTDRNMLLAQARVAMKQLITDIRQADSHSPINDSLVNNATTLFASGQVTENGGISLLKTQPDIDEPAIVSGVASTYVLITWTYDSTNKQIIRSRSVNGVATSTVKVNYAQDFEVRMEPARSAANVAAGNTSFDLLLRAVVSMQMQTIDANGKLALNQGSGLVTERLVDGAVPRKNFSGL